MGLLQGCYCVWILIVLLVLKFNGEGCHDEDDCCVGVVREEVMDVL